jgi:transposase-like protein
MGTSAEAVMTDKLGRRSGPRRKYTVDEKRSMVEETRVRGASVPEVAQRHGVNANLLSVWRRLYRRGLLKCEVRSTQSALLPVKVSTPTMLPDERAGVPKALKRERPVSVEVEFAGGQRLRIHGAVDRPLLRELIAALSSR